MVQSYLLGGAKCAFPYGHIGATWRIWLNLCFLRTTRVHNPNGKSIGSAVFAQLTVERCRVRWCHLAKRIELALPLAHQSPQPKWQVNRFSCFCAAHGKNFLYFTMSDPFPKIACSHGGSEPPSNTIPWAYPNPQPKGHLDRFCCFCTDDRRMSLYFTMGCPFIPLTIAPSHGRDLDPI